MALIKSITTNDTVAHPNAYWKVVETNLNWLNHSGRFVLEAWHDADARDGDNPAGSIYSIGVDIAKTANETEEGVILIPAFDDLFGETELDQADHNPVSQIYAWIKTQDDSNSVLGGLDWTTATDA